MPIGCNNCAVVVPVFNGARWICETIESALNQTHRPLEVIVVDDGSTDDSAAFAESYGRPVQVIRQPNQGESVARNVGASNARGEWLLFLDADDILAENALERFLAATLEGTPDVILAGYARFDHSIEDPLSVHMPAPSLIPKALFAAVAPQCAWLHRRDSFLLSGGFATDIRYGEDWDFGARLALSQPDVVTIPEVLAFYRRHPGGQSQNVNISAEKRRQFATVAARICGGVADAPETCSRFAEGVVRMALVHAENCRRDGLPRDDYAELIAQVNRLAHQARRLGVNSRLLRAICWFGPRWASQFQEYAERISFSRKLTAPVTDVNGAPLATR
jgi:glycosyltransferase involved in cell wall biosynthesis